MRPLPWLVLLACWLAVAAVEPGDRPALPGPVAEAAGEAIVVGADRVRRARLTGDAAAPLDAAGEHPLEAAALSLRAMAAGGVGDDDAAYADALAALRGAPFDDVLATAACAVALDAHGDPSDAARLADAAAWLLVRRDADGLWRGARGRSDVETSAEVLVALDAARRAEGDPAPDDLWADVVDGALDLRDDDGAFAADGRPAGDATAAAIVLLESAHRRLLTADAAPGVRRRAASAITDAWAWLDARFSVVGVPVGVDGAVRRRVDGHAGHHRFLDAVSRAADASGRAAIGGRDWAPAVALELLRTQDLDGAWGGLVDTCLGVVCLRRALGGPDALDASAAAAAWRHTSDAPAGAWKGLTFDDGDWALGLAAFGTQPAPGVDLRGAWAAGRGTLWMRRAFTWRDGEPEPSFAVRHDGPLELYVNGVAVGRWRDGTDGRRVVHGLSPAARRMLVDGRNVVAVWAKRDHDDQSVDVALVTPGEAPRARPWWRRAEGPAPDASFVRRWLVMGPVVDEPLHDARLDGREVSPRAGQRTRSGRWQETLAPGGFLDLAYVTDDADASLRYAFTWLHVERDVDAVLWIGSDDGVRVWLDGRVVHSHHRDRRARADEDAVPLALSEGPHRLLFEVDNREDRTGLFARLTDEHGDPLRDVRPALRDERPNWSAVALAHPELFSYAELHTLLTPARADRLDFAKSDVREDGLAIGPTHKGSSTWLPAGMRPRDTGDPTSRPPDMPHIPVAYGRHLPHPGARGVLELRPPAPGVPARLMRRVTLGDAISARVCADASADPTHAGATLRIGVWSVERGGDEPTWLHEVIVSSAAAPSEAQWRDVTVPTGELSGDDVLVVLEVAASPVHVGPDTLFLDELSFR